MDRDFSIVEVQFGDVFRNGLRQVADPAEILFSGLDDADKLKKLYAARYPVYTAAADVTVAVTGTPEDTMNAILECLQ